MDRKEAQRAPLVPARAPQGAEVRNSSRMEASDWTARMVSALATALKKVVAPETVGLSVLANTSSHKMGCSLSYDPTACETLPMRELPTGEPYAGKPPVRFGGRGGVTPFPTPIGSEGGVSDHPSRRQV